MAEKKAWIGIKINHCQFQGVIVADPVANGDYTFLTLKTSYSYQDPNGQYVEIDQDIPLMVEPNGPVNVVRNYIKEGRKLMAWCHYKTWPTEAGIQHAFVVKRFDLGDRPYEPKSPAAPPLPN